MSPINKLGKVAIGGLAACCCSYYLFQQKLSKILIDSEICKEAMELVNNHSGSKLYLGEPIKPNFAKFSTDGKGPEKSVVQILVAGPKSKGEVFLTINKISENQQKLGRILLKIGKDDSKRLEIKSSDQ